MRGKTLTILLITLAVVAGAGVLLIRSKSSSPLNGLIGKPPFQGLRVNEITAVEMKGAENTAALAEKTTSGSWRTDTTTSRIFPGSRGDHTSTVGKVINQLLHFLKRLLPLVPVLFVFLPQAKHHSMAPASASRPWRDKDRLPLACDALLLVQVDDVGETAIWRRSPIGNAAWWQVPR